MTNDPSETRPTWTDPTAPAEPARPAPGAGPVVPTQPVTVASAPAKRGRGPLDWLLIGAAVLAVGGVAFAIGRTSAPTATAVTFPNGATLDGGGPGFVVGGSFDPGAGGPAAGGPGFLGGGGGPTLDGTVTAVDATRLTLQLASGDTMTVTLDDETTYQEATPADASAVAVGDDVSVRVDGFGRGNLGNGGGNTGNGNTGATPDLTASDVTVTR